MNKSYNTKHHDSYLSDLLPLLESGLQKLNLAPDKIILEKIITYITLLNKWNKVHNLTAITDPQAILIRHIFDSLAITPFIIGPNILDFGTGAGLPGIPLALILPEYEFVLLDSANKKTAFLNHVVIELAIKNVKVVTKRIEEFHFAPHFATIVTRATAKADVVITKTSHLSASGGQILIMKGKEPQGELKFIQKPFVLHHIDVPYLNEERHIIIVKQT